MAESETRRGFLTKSVLVPLVVAIVPTGIGYYLTQRDLLQHGLNSRILYSDNGIPESESGLNDLDLAAGRKPIKTPGVPATAFDYVVVIANSGDYSEENIQTLVRYSANEPSQEPVSGFVLAASSTLLEGTVKIQEVDRHPWLFEIVIPRMNPGESVSHSSQWGAAIGVQVESRSLDVTSTDNVDAS